MFRSNVSRNTYQMQKISQYLRGVKSHPTAEEVYNYIRREIPTISLATVHRNLKKLAEQGIIRKFEVNKEYHYEADMCRHQHLICIRCGRIVDIFEEDISDYALKRARRKGLVVDCVNIIFKGRCKECDKGGKKNEKRHRRKKGSHARRA